jgi:hypothetical protein
MTNNPNEPIRMKPKSYLEEFMASSKISSKWQKLPLFYGIDRRKIKTKSPSTLVQSVNGP